MRGTERERRMYVDEVSYHYYLLLYYYTPYVGLYLQLAGETGYIYPSMAVGDEHELKGVHPNPKGEKVIQIPSIFSGHLIFSLFSNYFLSPISTVFLTSLISIKLFFVVPFYSASIAPRQQLERDKSDYDDSLEIDRASNQNKSISNRIGI